MKYKLREQFSLTPEGAKEPIVGPAEVDLDEATASANMHKLEVVDQPLDGGKKPKAQTQAQATA